MNMDTPMLVRALRARAASEQMQPDDTREDALVALLREARERIEELAGRTEPYREPQPFNFDDAVAQQIATYDPGSLVEAWVLIARHRSLEQSLDGRTGYVDHTPDSQPIDVTMGLLRYGILHADQIALQARVVGGEGE